MSWGGGRREVGEDANEGVVSVAAQVGSTVRRESH